MIIAYQLWHISDISPLPLVTLIAFSILKGKFTKIREKMTVFLISPYGIFCFYLLGFSDIVSQRSKMDVTEILFVVLKMNKNKITL